MNDCQREYPEFSACGLNCGLCPRYHTRGASRCPGCAGAGFFQKHPTCGTLSCCRRHGLEYCFLCQEYPCKKYDRADAVDSFITHRRRRGDFERVRLGGMDAYRAGLDEKIRLLSLLLERYDDGRRKGFYCLAVNLLELEDVRGAVEQLEARFAPEPGQVKERAAEAARLLQGAAEVRGVVLKLRKTPEVDPASIP